MGVKELVKQILIQKQNKRYERLLADRKMSYEDWLAEREAGGTDTENCTGEQDEDRDFVLILAGEGVPAESAVKNIARYFIENPQRLIVYGDEDVREAQGTRRCPWFKPDWSPDLLDSFFYFGSLVAVRRKLFEQMQGGAVLAKMDAAEEIPCYRVLDFTAYEQWMFECVRHAGGYEKGKRGRIGHVDRILFHGASEEQQQFFRQDSEVLRRRRQAWVRCFAEECAGEETMLSVIVPSKDNAEMLGKCLRAVKGAAGNLSFEVIVVDNGSKQKEKESVEKLIQELINGGMRIRYLYCPMEFNFSKMCNMGADAAKGKLLLFLNDDVELVQGNSLAETAALAHRAYTGAVGMKLCYPEAERIQHIGITNLPMGPVHKLQSLKNNESYYDNFGKGMRNFLAVTAAFLMVGREKFREAGGFSEELRVAFNDVDFCFRLYELGYDNVCVNDRFAYHFESFSRGDDESGEKLERLLEERRKLYARHPLLEGVDPYYASGLSREGLDVRVRPAYMTAGNRVQQISQAQKADLQGSRQDNCLTVRVEDFRGRQLVGWSVVLGDNNACYERWLLLKKVSQSRSFGGGAEQTAAAQTDSVQTETAGMIVTETTEIKATEIKATEIIYEAALEGSYRPDLEENMLDQVNVGLSGFRVEFGASPVPAGNYLVGMCARNRVTGLRLVNWSNRRIEL